MRLFLLFVLLVHLLLLSSCKKYKPADAAFFLRPGVISVSTDKIRQGSGSNKITDLWVYVNGKYQGAFPVGNLIPIVSKGNAVRINVFAGIKNNGISGTRTLWPFYDFLTIDTLVETGKTIERAFTFNYNSTTTFTWMENFDSGGVSLIPTSGSPSITIVSSENNFEGNSGELMIPASYQKGYQARIETPNYYTLPEGSSNVYLEFNYKCNQIFSLGVVTEYGIYKPALIVNPQENWNKIYVQLATALGASPTSNKHKIYFELPKLTDDSNPILFLDNIKLVYL